LGTSLTVRCMLPLILCKSYAQLATFLVISHSYREQYTRSAQQPVKPLMQSFTQRTANPVSFSVPTFQVCPNCPDAGSKALRTKIEHNNYNIHWGALPTLQESSAALNQYQTIDVTTGKTEHGTTGRKDDGTLIERRASTVGSLLKVAATTRFVWHLHGHSRQKG